MNDLEDQVQVSRMMSLPFRVVRSVPAETLVTSVPDDGAHVNSSSCVTADAISNRAHSIDSGANSSLPPPRHRCYRLLSSALSLLVRKSHCNSYLARQDGLW
jgi:hypothetical protein